MSDDNDACLCELDHHDPLRAVLQGTTSETGERFSGGRLQSLSQAFGTRYAWVKEYTEAGHIVLVRSDPRDIPKIIALSRATYRKMVQNLCGRRATKSSRFPWPQACLRREASSSTRPSGRS